MLTDSKREEVESEMDSNEHESSAKEELLPRISGV